MLGKRNLEIKFFYKTGSRLEKLENNSQEKYQVS